jgi:hypothetical protein
MGHRGIRSGGGYHHWSIRVVIGSGTRIQRYRINAAFHRSFHIPPHGLIRLKEGSMAHIIKRFDQPDGGGKLRVEDFCQTASPCA